MAKELVNLIVPREGGPFNSQFIDMDLWKLEGYYKRLDKHNGMTVGIKGMPGRSGIGTGHRPGEGFTFDSDGQNLISRIGNEDSQFYFSL